MIVILKCINSVCICLHMYLERSSLEFSMTPTYSEEGRRTSKSNGKMRHRFPTNTTSSQDSPGRKLRVCYLLLVLPLVKPDFILTINCSCTVANTHFYGIGVHDVYCHKRNFWWRQYSVHNFNFLRHIYVLRLALNMTCEYRESSLLLRCLL